MVVYPAKSLMARDLALVCHYQGLPLVARPGLLRGNRPSVNALSAAFVDVLQSNVPSAVSTIHRTAARLQVCTAPRADFAPCQHSWAGAACRSPGSASPVPPQTATGGQGFQLSLLAFLQAFRWNSAFITHDDNGDVAEECLLCPICRAPLMLAEAAGGKLTKGSALRALCCRSCSHQLAGVLEPSQAASERAAAMKDSATATQPSMPPFMRLRIEALRTGMLLEPENAD